MELKYKCRVCNNEYKTNEELETHKEENHGTKHVYDVEYLRCMDCSFQDPDKNVFLNHRKMHTTNANSTKNAEEKKSVEQSTHLICRNCKDSFKTKRLLMNHRRDNHPLSRRQCRYDLEDNCSYSSEECWYRHNTSRSEKQMHGTKSLSEGKVSEKRSEKYTCHSCKEEFRTKNNLMMHKKKSHPENCMLCEHFVSGECTRDKDCWYLHEQSDSLQTHECYICKDAFRTKNAVMIHKKQTHPETCKPCERFENGDCTKVDECWNIHEKQINKQGFQQARFAQGLP